MDRAGETMMVPGALRRIVWREQSCVTLEFLLLLIRSSMILIRSSKKRFFFRIVERVLEICIILQCHLFGDDRNEKRLSSCSFDEVWKISFNYFYSCYWEQTTNVCVVEIQRGRIFLVFYSKGIPEPHRRY